MWMYEEWVTLRKGRHDLFFSPNTISIIKPRRRRWTRHLALMGGMRNEYKIMDKNLKGRDHSENLGVDGRYSGLTNHKISYFTTLLSGWSGCTFIRSN